MIIITEDLLNEIKNSTMGRFGREILSNKFLKNPKHRRDIEYLERLKVSVMSFYIYIDDLTKRAS